MPWERAGAPEELKGVFIYEEHYDLPRCRLRRHRRRQPEERRPVLSHTPNRKEIFIMKNMMHRIAVAFAIIGDANRKNDGMF